MGGLKDAWSSAVSTASENSGLILGVAASVGAIAVGRAVYNLVRVKPESYSVIGHGKVDRKEVKAKFDDLDKGFAQTNGKGIEKKHTTPDLVNTFYDLVTDMYEWGWGQSFHFSPQTKGRSYAESNRLHEHYMGDKLELKPGMKALDVGCGVGGPMRAIAAHTGAKVTGITINEYQVNRCKHHNKRMGLEHLCNAVQGNFLKMPFENCTFDAVYAIEATCHAPSIEDVYKECFRVLKPGKLFGTYEWVTTKLYDKNNPEHVRIADSINYGNALPEMRSYQQCIDAAKKAGFEILISQDLALPPALPWYNKLKMGKWRMYLTHALVEVLSFLRIAPKGVKEVHAMLVQTAIDLVEGGETGTFTPMFFILGRKPLA
eukprot:jgi/Mesvir1/24109/Mv10830-RA.1